MFFLILLVILYGPRVCNKRLNNNNNNNNVSYIKNKISKGMGIIIKTRKYLN